MTKELLRETIERYLRISQSDFARMIGVSPGAVAQWLSGARKIPGPVSACIDLIMMLPVNKRERIIRDIKDYRKR